MAIAPKKAGETIVLAAAALSVCCAGPLDSLALVPVSVAPVLMELVGVVLAAFSALSGRFEDVMLELGVAEAVATALSTLVNDSVIELLVAVDAGADED